MCRGLELPGRGFEYVQGCGSGELLYLGVQAVALTCRFGKWEEFRSVFVMPCPGEANVAYLGLRMGE